MKYYVRDGRRFVKTDDLCGMYANREGNFTSIKTWDSYGVVVIHNFKEIVIAHLEVKPACTWYEAIKKYNLPTRIQLLTAFKFKSMFNPNSHTFWTNEESTFDFAYALYWSDSYIGDYSKCRDCHVREFTTIDL